jgi:hypothetical protein
LPDGMDQSVERKVGPGLTFTRGGLTHRECMGVR